MVALERSTAVALHFRVAVARLIALGCNQLHCRRRPCGASERACGVGFARSLMDPAERIVGVESGHRLRFLCTTVGLCSTRNEPLRLLRMIRLGGLERPEKGVWLPVAATRARSAAGPFQNALWDDLSRVGAPPWTVRPLALRDRYATVHITRPLLSRILVSARPTAL